MDQHQFNRYCYKVYQRYLVHRNKIALQVLRSHAMLLDLKLPEYITRAMMYTPLYRPVPTTITTTIPPAHTHGSS